MVSRARVEAQLMGASWSSDSISEPSRDERSMEWPVVQYRYLEKMNTNVV